MSGGRSDRIVDQARGGGLIRPGEPLLVLLSGGRDSVCLLDVAGTLGARVEALHVNHGLRPGADDEQAACVSLCERLGVPLIVERIELGERERRSGGGNLQAAAREARYGLAERHAVGDYAAAHTATDQAETVVYRLAVSPGRRALLGMEPRRGRLVRPLLEVGRGETRAYCRARSLPFVDDPSNRDVRYARARVRARVMPELAALNAEAERTIVETSRLLRDEHEVLELAVDRALEALGGPAVAVSSLSEQPRALARLVLRRLAEDAAGGPRSLVREEVDRVLALARRGGSASLDLGGGLRAVVEYGTLRLTTAGDPAAPEPVTLAIPGSVRFGAWEVSAAAGEVGEAVLSARALGGSALVRGWRDGDRMRPAGLDGHKSLQDLFSDRKVPRALRRTLPLLEVGDEIAWVAGLAVAERFRAGDDVPAHERVALSARRR